MILHLFIPTEYMNIIIKLQKNLLMSYQQEMNQTNHYQL